MARAAITATLQLIASLQGGSEVVFDYSDPPGDLSPAAHAAHQARAARVAALGEPFLSYFEPGALHAELTGLGFNHIDDLGPPGLLARFFPQVVAPDAPRSDRGGHVILAAKGP